MNKMKAIVNFINLKKLLKKNCLYKSWEKKNLKKKYLNKVEKII